MVSVGPARPPALVIGPATVLVSKEDTMSRSLLRKALVVPTLAFVTLAAVYGSAGAQPDPDYGGDYSAPYWIYADPADDAARQVFVENVKYDEFHPAPNWDAGDGRAEEQYDLAR
jgi:hypothetical protein